MSLNINHFILLFSITISIFSCESNADIEFPKEKKQVVLNSVLQCDSAIKVNLHWTGNPDDKNFIPITDASLKIYQNNNLLQKPIIANSKGNYTCDQIINEGEFYRIEAITNNAILQSSVQIPTKPVIEIEKSDHFDNNQKIFDVNIEQLDKSISALYFYIFTETLDDGIKMENHETALYCNSAFSDPFNRFLDDWGPEGFPHQYDYFIRFDASLLKNQKTNFSIATISGNDKIKITVISASKEYDMYYKSVYMQKSFDSEINLPFSYMPIPLPNNINGGLGLFGAINISIFDFK